MRALGRCWPHSLGCVEAAGRALHCLFTEMTDYQGSGVGGMANRVGIWGELGEFRAAGSAMRLAARAPRRMATRPAATRRQTAITGSAAAELTIRDRAGLQQPRDCDAPMLSHLSVRKEKGKRQLYCALGGLVI